MGRKLYSGKVRDIYEVDSGTWLMVTSDRISAFDVVLPQEIPDKGKVLTAMTAWWLEEFKDLAPNHVISFTDFARAIKENPELEEHYIYGRSMLVKKAEMLPIECIVRGYISGSSWKEYKDSGTIHHEPAPAGLKESDMLENPIFTPSTKATEGHDENITFQDAVNLIGKELAEKAKDICVTAYLKAREICNEKGIIVADTKFELGIIDDKLSFCDEVLTPDSSRFWPKDAWRPGSTPPSYDKQPVRDWLEASGWNKTPPAPDLPEEVVRQTSQRYRNAYEYISGLSLDDFPEKVHI